MKAMQISNPGGSDVMTYTDLPKPEPGEGQLLVKLEAIGVNFIDTYQRSGLYKLPLPFSPGNEGAGVVESVGAGVSGYSAGDRVAYTGVLGAYAEYTLLPADRAVKVPDGMETQQAGAIMLQGMTAHYLCHDTFSVSNGNKVLIHAGAGGVGLLLIQMCKILGATVFTTVSTDAKADLAKGAGADHVIKYSEQEFQEEVEKVAGKNALDCVFDSVAKTTFDKGLDLLRPRGMMVLYGQSSGPVPPIDLNILNPKGSLYVTRPSLGHYTASADDLQKRASQVLGSVASGRLNVRIGGTYPLANAKQSHDDLEGRKTTGKLLLLP